MISLDQEFSKADLEDRVHERKDVGEMQEEIDEENLPTPERNDNRTRQVSDWFRHLRYREGVFGESYPFCLADDGDTLYVGESLSVKQKLYIFLLLASNNRYSRRHTNVLTSCFEVVSKEALKKLMPQGAEVHMFGSKHHGRYTGTLWQKINKLAEDLNERVVAEERNFPPQNTGDGGLDVIGWVPTDDDLPSNLLVFGQCACTSDWVNKQHSSGPAAWMGKIAFKAPPSNVAFIPYFFRSTDGMWHNSDKIHQSVLIDRLRLSRILQDAPIFNCSLPAFEVVEEVLRQREALF